MSRAHTLLSTTDDHHHPHHRSTPHNHYDTPHRTHNSDDEAAEDYYTVKCPARGQSTIYGISSCYDTTYPSEQLDGLLGRTEFTHIVERVNDTILSYWPCTFAFCLTSFIYIPIVLLFTKILRFPDEYFMLTAEREAKALLHQYSLRASFYDHGIRVVLVKSRAWVAWDSWIEFRFPMGYVRRCRVMDGRQGKGEDEAAQEAGSASQNNHSSDSASASVTLSSENTNAVTATVGSLVTNNTGTHARYERKMA